MNDALMRFFEQCTKFLKDVDDNPAATEEVDKFNAGPEMKRITEKIADRLRVPYSLINDGQTDGIQYYLLLSQISSLISLICKFKKCDKVTIYVSIALYILGVYSETHFI